MASGIEEILTTLYEMVQDAWSLPLGADKCVLERDKVLDLLDEISNQLPGELKQAKTIVESRNEVITNAKREAENILKQAEQRARQMISHEEVYLQAQKEADDLMKNAQAKIKELRQVMQEFCGPEFPIYMGRGDGSYVAVRLEDLLPYGFTAEKYMK